MLCGHFANNGEIDKLTSVGDTFGFLIMEMEMGSG